jgi:diacylglycerol O-acyltransferase
VHRLKGIEASFLFAENDTQNANTGCMVTFRPDDGRPITLAQWRDHMASRIDLLPALRWHVRDVPLGLHHPVFVDDPNFDLDRQLRAVTLEGRDDPEKELNLLLAETIQRPLDRRYSLWQMTLVTGLTDGRQAIIFMVHHVLTDGVALTTTLRRLFSDDISAELSAAVPWRPEDPSGRRLVKDALVAQAKLWRGLPRLISDSRRGFRAQREHRAERSGGVPFVASPKLPVSSTFTPSNDRIFARAVLDLGQLRRVKAAAGVTLNDALMAVVAIALRRYLLERGQLPAAPLVSGVMMSTEALDAPPRQFGNFFANFITSLATDADDPWEQMLAISAATAEAKTCLELVGLDIPERWLDMIPPALAVPMARKSDKAAREHPERVRASATVSNMRGVQGFHFLSCTMDGIYVFGPLADSLGLFVAAYALADQFDMTVISNPTALDRPDLLADGFAAALAELVELAAAHADNG